MTFLYFSDSTGSGVEIGIAAISLSTGQVGLGVEGSLTVRYTSHRYTLRLGGAD
jgi:hypothetical protein